MLISDEEIIIIIIIIICALLKNGTQYSFKVEYIPWVTK